MIASRMLSFSYNFVNSIFVSFPLRFVSFSIPVLFLLLLLFLLVLPFNTWNVSETFIEFTRVYTEIFQTQLVSLPVPTRFLEKARRPDDVVHVSFD